MGLLPGSGGAAEGELRPDGVEFPRSELRPDAVQGGRAQLGPGRAAPPETIEPLAPGRYKVQFTASAELRDKLDRLRALMRSSVPDGDLAAIIDAAVTEKLERLEARRFGRTKAPRKEPSAAQGPPSSRHVPAAVRRAVYERDGGRCRYVDDQGRRCSAREGLEFHHRHPFAFGGHHSVDEMALLCRTHNGLLAEIDFGRGAVARHRRSDAVTRTAHREAADTVLPMSCRFLPMNGRVFSRAADGPSLSVIVSGAARPRGLSRAWLRLRVGQCLCTLACEVTSGGQRAGRAPIVAGKSPRSREPAATSY